MKLDQVARRYEQIGIAVVPSRPQTKQPLVRWKDPHFIEVVNGMWENKLLKQEYEEKLINKFFLEKQPGQINIAGILGKPSQGLAVLDIDFEAEFNIIELFQNKKVWIQKSGKGYHIFFRIKDADYDVLPSVIIAKSPKGNIEFRLHDCLVMLSPSVHPNGKMYSWLTPQTQDMGVFSFEEALTWANRFIVDNFDAEPFKVWNHEEKEVELSNEIDTEKWKELHGKLSSWIVTALSLEPQEGERNETAMRLVSVLSQSGLKPDDIQIIMNRWYYEVVHNHANFSWGEVKNIIKSVLSKGYIFSAKKLREVSAFKIALKDYKDKIPKPIKQDVLEGILDEIQSVEVVRGEKGAVVIVVKHDDKTHKLLFKLSELHESPRQFVTKYWEHFLIKLSLDKDTWEVLRDNIINMATVTEGEQTEGSIEKSAQEIIDMFKGVQVVENKDEKKGLIELERAFVEIIENKKILYLPTSLIMRNLQDKFSDPQNIISKIYLFWADMVFGKNTRKSMWVRLRGKTKRVKYVPLILPATEGESNVETKTVSN